MLMIIVMAFLDMVGIASIMPFMAVLTDPDIINQNQYLSQVYQLLSFSDQKTFLFFLGLLVFSLLIISMGFKALTTWHQVRFTTMAEYTLGCRLVSGYLGQPYEWFLNRHSADLGKSVLSEVSQAINNSMTPLMQCIAQTAVITAILTLLVAVDPMLAFVISSILGCAYGLLYLALRNLLGRISIKRVAANKARFQAITEAFGGIKDVKVSGQEQTFLTRFSVPAHMFSKYQAISKLSGQLPRFALEAISFGGMILLVLFLMRDGKELQSALPILTLYAFAGYRLLPAVQIFYQNLATLRFGGAALLSLHQDLVSLPISPTYKDNTQLQPISIRNNIQLDKICYSYPYTSKKAVNSLSINIPARSTVGFIGKTGSGKTTTVDIILGLIHPHSGRLSVDGVAITAENVRSWQRAIGYVPQYIYLSDDTIAGNIAFGVDKKYIDYAAVKRAAKVANLHNFITTELAQGYYTNIGERGIRLSGGQRQRIGIARALYNNPQLLILDEATSALDNLTEKHVMEAVENISHSLTVIMIAHRLSTVQKCDNIYVIENGTITKSGDYNTISQESIFFSK
ncbi:ABC transporter ATP-binding protein [Thalassospira australica]|uniref:ABC transporter ATP-binding protein n=1 Tax=Thalassospira australica TaxID=1528106 RepID=UPI00384D7418